MEHIIAREVILVLIDISGYTRFMVANKDEVHSQQIIGQLIGDLIDEIKLPFRISKLEGDAIFLYAVRHHTRAWEEEKLTIGHKLEKFFTVFSDSLLKLSESKLCSSALCKSLNKLKLKMFVHHGTAYFQTIRGYEELAGVDVITVHRLLKNKIKDDRYLLLTQSAVEELNFAPGDSFKKHIESDSELGHITTFLYLPKETPCEVHA